MKMVSWGLAGIRDLIRTKYEQFVNHKEFFSWVNENNWMICYFINKSYKKFVKSNPIQINQSYEG